MIPKLYQEVVLLQDFPDYEMKKGDIATLVDYVPHPDKGEEGCILEVFNDSGESIDVVTVPCSTIKRYLSGADLHEADLNGADLHSEDLTRANLYDADLRGAFLHQADLSGANLRNADLSNADLHNAVLHCADLSGAVLRNANLEGADLSGANLTSVILVDANVTQTMFGWGLGLSEPEKRELRQRGAIFNDASVIA